MRHYQIRVFDILREWEFLPYNMLLDSTDLQCAPSLDVHPFNLEKLKAMAEGDSLIIVANHIQEGIVVRPIADRFTYEIGRLQLKIISNAYLEHG